MALYLCRDGHAVGDTLEVLDGTTKVDTTHGLDVYLQLLELLDGRQL